MIQTLRQSFAGIAAWAILALLPLPLILILHAGLVDSWEALVIYDLGVIAYVWWLAIVVLATRPRWLDRRVGLPSVYQMHGVLALVALISSSIHVTGSFTWHGAIYWTGRIAWYLAIFGLVFSVLLMSGWFADRVPAFADLKRICERIFTHEVKIWVHRLHFLVIGLILIHVHVIPRLQTVPGFVLAVDAYTVLAMGIFVWARFVASSSPKREGVVTHNYAINDSTLSLVVELDENAEPFEPGDYYWLRILTPELRGQSHPFSVTRAPAAGHKEVTFTIRELGDFTRRLGAVEPGTRVQLEGPFGRFHRILSGDLPNRPVVLIGMGTGIAPLVGLAEVHAGSRPLWFLHSARSPADVLYRDELESLAATREGMTYRHSLHRFSAADLRDILGSELQAARYVIVGPAAGVVGMTRVLRSLGVRKASIAHERMTM